MKNRTCADYIRARHLFLQITRGRNSWSDGNRVVEGEELAGLRRRALHQIVERRQIERAPEDADLRRSMNSNEMEWRNFATMDRMTVRQDRREGRQRGLEARLQLSLMKARLATDPASARRLCLVRRNIRKRFPDLYENLRPIARMSKKEQDFWSRAQDRKLLVTRVDIDFDGIKVPAGHPVELNDQGSYQLASWLRVHPVIYPAQVRAVRPSRTKGRGVKMETDAALQNDPEFRP